MKSNGATGRFKLNNANEIEVERANGRGFSALATVKPITSAQLATYRGVLGEVVEVTNVAGRPQYRWDGAAFVPMVTAKTDPVTAEVMVSAGDVNLTSWVKEQAKRDANPTIGNSLLLGGGPSATPATYTVAGRLVTVAWTAHGLSAVQDGARAHMTIGSGPLTTGWFKNFRYVDVNTFTVFAPASVTGSGALAVNTSEVIVGEIKIPGGTLGDYGSIRCRSVVSANASTVGRTLYRRLNTVPGTTTGSTSLRVYSIASTHTQVLTEDEVFNRGNPFNQITTHSSSSTASVDGVILTPSAMSKNSDKDLYAMTSLKCGRGEDWLFLEAFSCSMNSTGRTAVAGEYGVGVNVSGLEFGAAIPGVVGVDYHIPPEQDFTYFIGKGLTTIRLPFTWARVQPVLGAALDPTYLGYIRTCLDQIAAAGGTAILDCHSFGAHNGVNIGTGAVTSAAFADLWSRLATEFVGHAALARTGGYDLMNEPATSITLPTWKAAAQAAVDAIRLVDSASRIYVEGIQFSGASSWLTYNAGLILNDPSDRLVYSAHVYMDRDMSGTHYDWATEVAAGSYAGVSVDRLAPFIGWCLKNGVVGHIGEIGVGTVGTAPDGSTWLSELETALAYCKKYGVEVSYWSGGSAWSAGYGYSLQPTSGYTQDKPQMAVLRGSLQQ